MPPFSLRSPGGPSATGADPASTETARVPVSINKYLLPSEDRIAAVRMHPAVLIPSSALALGGLLVAGLLTGTVVTGAAAAIIWILWGVLLVRLIWKVFNWMVDYFVITTARLLLI